MDWQSILQQARSLGASDVHLSAGEVPWLRIDGKMRRWVDPRSPANWQTLEARSLLEFLEVLRPSKLDLPLPVGPVIRTKPCACRPQEATHSGAPSVFKFGNVSEIRRKAMAGPRA